MPLTSSIETGELQTFWDLANAESVEINALGRIVDFLDPNVTRADKPEERIRQGYARILAEEYGYPKELLAFEAPINIGSETKFADIAVYNSADARIRHEQG